MLFEVGKGYRKLDISQWNSWAYIKVILACCACNMLGGMVGGRINVFWGVILALLGLGPRGALDPRDCSRKQRQHPC